jgi:hypothetical protein
LPAGATVDGGPWTVDVPGSIVYSITGMTFGPLSHIVATGKVAIGIMRLSPRKDARLLTLAGLLLALGTLAAPSAFAQEGRDAGVS